MFSASWAGNSGGSASAALGGIMFLTGAGVTIVGLPILIIGSSRVKEIEGIKNSMNTGMVIELAPCNFHNFMAQTRQAGVTLRIKF